MRVGGCKELPKMMLRSGGGSLSEETLVWLVLPSSLFVSFMVDGDSVWMHGAS